MIPRYIWLSDTSGSIDCMTNTFIPKYIHANGWGDKTDLNSDDHSDPQQLSFKSGRKNTREFYSTVFDLCINNQYGDTAIFIK